MGPEAPAITIREARPDEYAALGELIAEAYRSTGVAEREEYLDTVRDVAARAGSCTILVAEGAGGELLGGVTYVPGPGGPYAESEGEDEAGFRMLGVAEAARGLGIGRALVQACIDRARASGRRRLVLLTLPTMVAAHRIYDALGFDRAPERDWTLESGTDLLGYEYEIET
jgi:ribosomal protein S18 acetylase RimI-like enzyme